MKHCMGCALKGCGLLIITFIIFSLVSLKMCSDSAKNSCRYTVVQTAKSPDGKFVAALFEGGCAGESSLRNYVKISKGEFEPSRECGRDSLNAFGKDVFVASNTSIAISWSSDNALKIVYAYNPSQTDIALQEKNVFDIQVEYVLNFVENPVSEKGN